MRNRPWLDISLSRKLLLDGSNIYQSVPDLYYWKLANTELGQVRFKTL